MNRTEAVLPRIVAAIVLVVSIVMLAPIGTAAARLARGRPVPLLTWLPALLLLATGSVLMWLLSRKQLALRLYLTAFALWLLTAGYFFVRVVLTMT